MANDMMAVSGNCLVLRARFSGLLFTAITFCLNNSLCNFALAQPPEHTADKKVDRMARIQITLASGKQLLASIDNSAAAKDFLSLLPLTLTLDDYHKTEKVSDLPRRLSTQGEPEGFDPDVGDITYYAPWGNLAIFYRDFGYSRGLVKLGSIESGIELLQHKGAIDVTIEKAK